MVKKDYSKWSKEQVINRVKELEKRKKYGLVWDEEKELELVVTQCKEKLPVLKEVKDKEIYNKEDKSKNILIEGDNYHALSVLNYTHKGKVDVIYIDPPYNTGKKDEWKYNDKWVSSDDFYRHSKWLNMMEKRLMLAHNLLKNDGVIFISIDDNEFAQLKLLCDGIFTESNFVGIITWERKRKGSFLSDKFTKKTEYIMIYSKRGKEIKLFGQSSGETEDQPLIKRTNSSKELIIPHILIETKLPDGKYSVGKYGNGTSSIELLKEVIVKNGKFINDLHMKGPFIWTQKNTDQEIKLGAKFFIRTNNFSLRALKGKESQGMKALGSLLTMEVGTNEDANEELKNILLEERSFEYPKPVSLIKLLIQSRSYFNKNLIILDFFAGSGTTGHAVLDLNKEDGGNRKFILCTNNENKICEDVCYPRIKKVIGGYKNSRGEKIEGLGGNLKYFKTDFVDAEPTDKNKIKLTKEATEMLCLKEDTFDPVTEKAKFKIFRNGEKYTGIILDHKGIKEFKKAIKDIKGEFNIYVFSLGDDTFDEEFEDLTQKFKLSPIPEVILRVYRRIFNKL